MFCCAPSRLLLNFPSSWLGLQIYFLDVSCWGHPVSCLCLLALGCRYNTYWATFIDSIDSIYRIDMLHLSLGTRKRSCVGSSQATARLIGWLNRGH